MHGVCWGGRRSGPPPAEDSAPVGGGEESTNGAATFVAELGCPQVMLGQRSGRLGGQRAGCNVDGEAAQLLTARVNVTIIARWDYARPSGMAEMSSLISKLSRSLLLRCHRDVQFVNEEKCNAAVHSARTSTYVGAWVASLLSGKVGRY